MENEQNKQTQDTTSKENNNQSAFKENNNQSAQISKTNQSGNAGVSHSQNKTDSADKAGSPELSIDAAKETAKGIYDQAKSTVGQAYGAATKRATEVLDEQKGTLAGGLTSVADSIKQVGENLNSTDEQNKITETAAKYTNSLATQIENISGYFERKEVREMVSDIESFARKYPAYFIGGALALGFVAARFLKSSNPKQLTKGSGRTFNTDAKSATNPS
ncbi:MAG TPA: hypothetical protein VNB22_08665 [Pyrinomonadaceae bacterium]|jgi:hypothetical protein|nr:hypothetical protein [Pyrinomonadaceae bacterium]